MNNKKLFKGALVLFASILMAVSCSNNPANPEDPNKPNTPEQPVKEKLAITLKSDANNDGSTQAKAIKFEMQNETTAPASLPEIIFDGADSKDLKFTGTEGIVGKVKSVKGLKGAEITENSFNSKNTKADITLTDKSKVTIAAVSSAKDKCSITFESTTLQTIGQAIASTEKFGMVEVVITFTDNSGTKEPVDVTVLVGITRKA